MIIKFATQKGINLFEALGIPEHRAHEIHILVNMPHTSPDVFVHLAYLASFCKDQNELLALMFLVGQISCIPPKSFSEAMLDHDPSIQN